MIILFDKQAKTQNMEERVKLYYRCLDYLAAEMKNDGLDCAANILEVAQYALLERPTNLPTDIQEARKKIKGRNSK